MLREAIRRLSKHTFVYTAAEQASRLAGFLLIPLYTHPNYLSESEFGTRELLTVSLAWLGQLAGVNVTAAMARFYFEEGTSDHSRRVASTTILSLAGVTLLLVLGLGLASPWVGSLYRSDYPGFTRLFQITLGILFFQMLREVQSKVLQVQERSLLFGIVSFSKLVVEIGLQITFLVGLGLGLEGLFLAVLVSECAFSLVLCAIVLPKVGLAFSPAIFATLYAFALPLIPNGLLQFCLHSADRFLLNWMAGEDSVGIYALAYRLGYLSNYLVLGPFLLIWYPYLFSLRDEGKQRLLVGRLSPYVMLVMTAIGFAVSCFAEEIVRLMAGQPGYYVGWRAVPLVALGYWFWALYQLAQTGFYVRRATGRLPRITALAVLVNVGANLALIPLAGFLGAAVATAATFAFLVVATYRAAQPLFPVEFPWRRIFAPLCAAVILVVLPLAARGLCSEGTMLLLRALAAVAWLVWTWAGGFFGPVERLAIRDAVGGWARRGKAL